MFFATSKSREKSKIRYMGVLKTNDNIQIKIKIPNPSQEPPAPTKSPNQDLKDMDVLCTFKIKIESHHSDHRCIKDKWPYPNKDQDAIPQKGTSSVLQSSKSGLKGHGCSLHHHNKDRESKLGPRVYQRPVTISKSISGCPTPVRNFQRPPKPQMRT